MSKLFKLKEWLTLDAAANSLAMVLSEPITVADLLQLALERQLVLSVRLIDLTPAVLGHEGGVESIFGANTDPQWVESLDATLAASPRFVPNYLGGWRCIEWDESAIELIDGVWDLPMLSGESYAVEGAFAHALNSPLPELPLHEGIYLKRHDAYCRLMESLSDAGLSGTETVNDSDFVDLWDRPQEHGQANRKRYRDGFCPALILPDSAQLVIRTSSLNSFIASLSEPSQHAKPLGTREKNSLLTLIAVFATEANFDLNQKGIATSIAKAASLRGYQITDDTINKYIKQVRELYPPETDDSVDSSGGDGRL